MFIKGVAHYTPSAEGCWIKKNPCDLTEHHAMEAYWGVEV
jgi:hypothetical protein